MHVASSWFTISGAGGFKALISGILLAIFLYSGWDTAAYVGEEAKGKKAGQAAIMSVVILFFIYAFTVFAFQGVAPGPGANTPMQQHAGNILAFVGDKIGGSFWKNVMIVAVLGGTLAIAAGGHRQLGAHLVRHGPRPRLPEVLRQRPPQVPARRGTPPSCWACLNIVFLWGTTLFSSSAAPWRTSSARSD